jgi:hypothetical protein
MRKLTLFRQPVADNVVDNVIDSRAQPVIARLGSG